MVSGYQSALCKLWTGRCDVFVRETTVNPANGRNEPMEVQKLASEPCRLSFSNTSSTTEKGEAALIQQVVKLFISKEAEIPPGSKIVVTQNGITQVFTHSGEPAIYSSHQEIVLETFKEYA